MIISLSIIRIQSRQINFQLFPSSRVVNDYYLHKQLKSKHFFEDLLNFRISSAVPILSVDPDDPGLGLRVIKGEDENFLMGVI